MKRLLSTFLIAISGLFFTGCGKNQNPQIEGLIGPNFDITQSKVIVTMVIEKVQFEGNGEFGIPYLENSMVRVSQTDKGTKFEAVLDVKDIESSEVEFTDPQTLPGGRPIPGVVGGTMAGVAVEIPRLYHTTFYAGKKMFGVFVPFSLKMDGIVTYRLFVNNKPIGNISAVGQDENGENSGVFLLFNIDLKMKKELLRMMKKSPRA